jgi:hypothetical protein
VEGAVAATDSEPDEADPEPSKVAGSREARGSRRVKATDRRR